MAAPSDPHRWRYDVFVSFRGEDIRKSFMDHMFNDFNQKGIRAFRDDNELPKGEEISPHLYKAIEESRFLIVIFSKNYASSSWCLRELAKILECKEMGCPKHEVQIIFYDVKPNVVRKQTESYAESFAKHQDLKRPEVDKWKEALSMAANLSGWDLQDMTNGFESKFINSISREILKKLCDGPLHVGENLVGIDFHFEKLNLSRLVGSDKVNMIGICGISGIGKTTLAKAIYNLMYVHFEGSCFCEDVKEFTKRQGIIQVQMYMINKILKTEDLLKVSCVGEGSMVIKQRMACKPILLVLDDVDHRDQLEALAGSASWFYPGSLIIFTGKDKQLLRSHRVDEIHDMKFLDDDQSLQLFSLYAFEEKHPSTGFQGLANKAVKYVRGHPLALKVLGCFLYGKTVGEWVSELGRLRLHPNEEIQRVLRLSYDGLNNHQQNILLDIACLFIGKNSDFVASILDGCNFFADTNMRVLVDKSLITISSNMSLQMHNLIQAMAREIIHEESIMTGKQRRLWNSSEVYSLLSEKKVPMTEAIEVLVLFLRDTSQKVHINANSFALMKNLRILKLYAEEEFDQKRELNGYNVKYSGSLYFLSNELRLFCWHGCPFKCLPSQFYPENIVSIDLSYSHIKHLWTTPKCFRRLKFMKLRYCLYLTSTPDFTDIGNLEELILEGCKTLVKVHPSIGMLKKLLVLNMRDCTCLKSFPSKLEMDSLRILVLSGCLKLDKLPEDLGRIKSLTELHADTTAITEVPSFVSSLINLESLSFDGQGRIQPKWWTSITAPFSLRSKKQHPPRSLSLAGLHMLKDLNLSYCNLAQVPDGLGGLSCLKYLDLKGNNFTSFPGSLSQLSHLNTLDLEGCKKLEVLPELPHCLEYILARGCSSLCSIKRSSKDPIMSKSSAYLSNCPKLFTNLAIDSQASISESQCLDSSIISQGSTDEFSPFLQYVGIQNKICEFFRLPGSFMKRMDIIYKGSSIPKWFTNKSRENYAKVELPSDWSHNKFRGFGTCIVFKRKKRYKFIGYSVTNFNGSSLGGCSPYYHREYFEGMPIRINESYKWLHYTGDTKEWKKANNFATFCFEENNEDIEVKECGVRLVCDEDLEQDDTSLHMLQNLSTLSQHGGALRLSGVGGEIIWSC